MYHLLPEGGKAGREEAEPGPGTAEQRATVGGEAHHAHLTSSESSLPAAKSRGDTKGVVVVATWLNAQEDQEALGCGARSGGARSRARAQAPTAAGGGGSQPMLCLPGSRPCLSFPFHARIGVNLTKGGAARAAISAHGSLGSGRGWLPLRRR